MLKPVHGQQNASVQDRSIVPYLVRSHMHWACARGREHSVSSLFWANSGGEKQVKWIIIDLRPVRYFKASASCWMYRCPWSHILPGGIKSQSWKQEPSKASSGIRDHSPAELAVVCRVYYFVQLPNQEQDRTKMTTKGSPCERCVTTCDQLETFLLKTPF